jgi:hypothetical protein
VSDRLRDVLANFDDLKALYSGGSLEKMSGD